jgi:hypothetical protein
MVSMVESHAEDIISSLVDKLQSNPRTPHYQLLSRDELRHRTYEVCRDLGRWLTRETDESIEGIFGELGKIRFAQDVPLGEIVYGLILTKYHFRDYITTSGLADSAMDLYQERELQRQIGQFFDKAIYYTVQAYMREASELQERFAADRAS